MDPHHSELFSTLWADAERASQSPENDGHFGGFFSEFPTGQDFPRTFRLNTEGQTGIRAPLPSPTNIAPGNAVSTANGLFPPVLQFSGNMMLPTYSQASKPSTYPTILRTAPVRSPLSAFHFFPEESPSTDATPESSDVEEDNHVRKKKRSKKLLSDEETAKHSEDAQRFPRFLSDLRTKLLGESPDGRVHEGIAVSALIQEFTRVDEATKFTLPAQCELWLKMASERVQEQRQMSRGSRKKKNSESAASIGGGERGFYCQLCSEQEMKVFKTQEGLNLHIRNKHEADKQWKCLAPGCAVSFVRQADLRMHLIRMHSPHRPFPCKVPFCLKSFAGVSELRRHVKVDHRNLVCQLCGLPPPNQDS